MNAYQKYAVMKDITDESDKAKLLLKVYETILDKHEVVKAAIVEKDYKKKYEALSKITTALQLLNESLDMSYGEIPRNLSSLYAYLMRRLREVNTTLDIGTVEESQKIIRTILNGFSSAYENDRRYSNSAADSERNISMSSRMMV